MTKISKNYVFFSKIGEDSGKIYVLIHCTLMGQNEPKVVMMYDEFNKKSFFYSEKILEKIPLPEMNGKRQ